MDSQKKQIIGICPYISILYLSLHILVSIPSHLLHFIQWFLLFSIANQVVKSYQFLYWNSLNSLF